MKIKLGLAAAAAILACSMGLAACSAGPTQVAEPPARPDGAGGPGGAPQGRPTQDMLAACADRSAGDSCSAAGSDGQTRAGTCRAPQGRPMACRPAGAPQNSQGPEVDGTRADTDGVLCDLETNRQNPTLSIASTARWSCAAGQRTLASNGIPDHPIGAFPNAGNPNRVSAQSIAFSATTTPAVRSGAGAFVRTIGYALNGVKFEPGTAGACDSAITSPAQCDLGRGAGPWRTEALGQTVFNFGVDENLGHVQPTGEYHYHGVPDGVLTPENRAGQAMQLIGWAADGFPIYARVGYASAMDPASGLRVMRPSYRLKAAPDAGRPSVSLIPMGAFTQDWEYAPGSGDLDECNGRTGATPEFPNGIYHYYATDAYPYVQRCVRGAAPAETGPPPGGRGGRP